jgi:quinol monooxygenase YgiN
MVCNSFTRQIQEEIMSDQKLTVLARITAKPEHEEEVFKELCALVVPTHAEAGCINYELHRSQEDPARFFLYENWQSRKALDEHLAMPYLQAFLGKAADLLAEPVEISFWDRVA